MYTSFEIKNFKCFEHLELEDLARVNLISGKNNVGKTTLLEALYHHSGAYNPRLLLDLMRLRGWTQFKVELSSSSTAPWDSFFRDFDTQRQIVLTNRDSVRRGAITRLRFVPEPDDAAIPAGEQRSLIEGMESDITSNEAPLALEQVREEGEKIDRCWLMFRDGEFRVKPSPPRPPFTAVFVGARIRVVHKYLAERFSRIEVEGRHESFVRSLRSIEPTLQRLAVVVSGEVAMIHGDVGLGRLVPLADMGGGIVGLTDLLLAISQAENGMVLVDEIENGLHHSVMGKVWKAIGDAAREFSVQVFATTHSDECIKAAMEAYKAEQADDLFRFHRLERVKGEIRALSYDQEALSGALDIGLEVR